METVLVMGEYDAHNTGDDALMLATLYGAVKFWGSRHIYVAARQIADCSFKVKATPIYSNSGQFRGRAWLSRVATGLRVDAAVWGGGSLFHENSRLVQLELLARILRMRGVRLAAIGVSVGPFQSAKQRLRCRKFLNNLEFLGLRDTSSLQMVQELQPRCRYELTFDLAPLLKELWMPDTVIANHVRRKEREKVLGVAACQFQPYTGGRKGKNERTPIAIAHALRLVSEKHRIRCRLFEFQKHSARGEQILNEQLINLLRGYVAVEVVPYSSNPFNALTAIHSCDLVVAMRLHASIFAYITNTPFIVLDYHPKCKEIAKYIGVDPCNILPADHFDPGILADRISNGLEVPATWCQLPFEMARERAIRNFTSFYSWEIT